MRLRSQFAAFVSLAVVMGGAALATLMLSVSQAREVSRAQERSVAIAHEVTGLLVLTQDYLLHGEPRAQQQWQARYVRLTQAAARGGMAEDAEARELADEIDALPEAFSELQRLSGPAGDSPLATRRRELLVDRVLTEAQALAEHAYELEGKSTRRRDESEFRLVSLAAGLLAMLALLFTGAGWLLARRVLRPLAALRSAVDAVAAGDLRVRHASVSNDELGDLARQFDRMTEQLAERGDALRSSEALLRLVTDNLPAMIGYWDTDLRNRFANADYLRWFGKTPEEIKGRRIDELLGPDLYEKNRPFIDAALAGRRQDFDREIPGSDGVVRYSQASYIPDTHTGRMEGFFVLVTDVTDRVRGEQALAKALAEHETLLKEVYHRVKNNLQVVQSLLNLQSRSVHEASARDALQEMAQRVRAMALVHEQLYRSHSLSAVALQRYVEQLAHQIALGMDLGAGQVGLEVDVARMDIGIDAAVPLGLLLTELITNSYKHGFPQGRHGSITVSIRQQPEGVRIAVADDGAGLPADFDACRLRSIGLQLAAGLARQLGGELQFSSGPGTTAWLVVPHF
jgi:PAS domain S-box-containing protein